MIITLLLNILLYSSLTLLIYLPFVHWQNKLNKIWFNPMLFTIFIVIGVLLTFDISYQNYAQATTGLSHLLEPAVVALGYPLYQQLHVMRSKWKQIMILLTIAAVAVIAVSYTFTMLVIKLPAVAVSLSLKSITMPIGIALTEQLQGNSAITAFAIILAGLFGAILGIKWLTFINITSPKAQGLAIGTASHVLGTATISQLSYQHAAYSSLALIVSATITAIISPSLITELQLIYP